MYKGLTIENQAFKTELSNLVSSVMKERGFSLDKASLTLTNALTDALGLMRKTTTQKRRKLTLRDTLREIQEAYTDELEDYAVSGYLTDMISDIEFVDDEREQDYYENHPITDNSLSAGQLGIKTGRG